ncbi:MAG: hypothetical protein DMG83_12845 [Acidobacteria bacterium]|nr:MAG: hypothetical protein DMG83_12845 [Acidobacteriota bacterium]
MLVELRLENYAVIENLAVAFASGLNLLTGETGAGKSVLIDALSLLLAVPRRPSPASSKTMDSIPNAIPSSCDAKLLWAVRDASSSITSRPRSRF